jgi:hypothetical protein
MAPVGLAESTDGVFWFANKVLTYAKTPVDTEFQLSGPAHAAWQQLSDAFSALMKSEWDVTADRSKRSGEERSSATRVVDRRPVSLSSAELPIIQSKYQALRWQNANGGDLYVYPGFIVMFQDENTFALLDLKEADTTLTLRSSKKQALIRWMQSG